MAKGASERGRGQRPCPVLPSFQALGEAIRSSIRQPGRRHGKRQGQPDRAGGSPSAEDQLFGCRDRGAGAGVLSLQRGSALVGPASPEQEALYSIPAKSKRGGTRLGGGGEALVQPREGRPLWLKALPIPSPAAAAALSNSSE